MDTPFQGAFDGNFELSAILSPFDDTARAELISMVVANWVQRSQLNASGTMRAESFFVESWLGYWTQVLRSFL